jgi:para-aminobenzoate synthetase/4-amino-4-deoxychorismate lyase
MLESASFFGYPLDREVLGALLDRIAARLARRAGAKVRVLCDRTGRLRWESAPLRSGIRPGRDLVFSESPVDRTNLFLFHKTTFRPWYEAAMARAARGRMYDTVFENTDGQITECSMNNIFVEAGGALYTPPIECGLLPGVLRQVLLRRGACREKILTRDDIMGADGVYCGNSVRGLVKVAVCGKNGR